MIRKTLRRVDLLLVLGERLSSMYNFEPALKDRISVVPNGLPTPYPGKWKELNSSSNVELLFLSNLIESKGYFDVLEAVRFLRDEFHLNVTARFAGEFLGSSDDTVGSADEDFRKRFFQFIRVHELENNVEYVGSVSGKRKWELLERAEFFLLPTNYVNEGQPVSIIEAMAYGCVTVSTDFRAIPDLVVDGVTGVMVDYHAPKQIAAAVALIANDPDRFSEMSRAAVIRYREKFTMEAHLESIIPHIVPD